MLRGNRLYRGTLWVCILLFALHAVVDLCLPADAVLIPSGTLMLVELLVCAAACLWRAVLSRGTARQLWALAAASQMVIFLANVLTGLELTSNALSRQRTMPSDFVILLWCVPVLFAVGFSSEGRAPRLFYWLDSVQIVLLATLTAAACLGWLPFGLLREQPVTTLRAVVFFTAELGMMAVVAALRLLSRPDGPQVRRFWQCALLLFSLHAIFDSLYNIVNLISVLPPYRMQMVMALPSLGATLCILHPMRAQTFRKRTPFEKNLALFLDSGSPLVYTLMVVVLAIVCAKRDLMLSFVVVVVSLLTYGVRSTVLQVRYLWAQITMSRTEAKLRRLTLIDPLTGVANRRSFDNRLRIAWEQSQASQMPLAALVIDVDYFKLLNDRFGHAEGDRTLRSIAYALRSVFRNEGDLIARIGGEEFCALLQNMDVQDALAVARRMRRAVEALELRTENPMGTMVTISIGVAVSTGLGSGQDMVQRADRALYQAKLNGRNRAVAACPPQSGAPEPGLPLYDQTDWLEGSA